VRICVVQSAGGRYFAGIGSKGNIQGHRLFDRTRSSQNGSLNSLFFRRDCVRAKTAGAERRQISDRRCERLLGRQEERQ
jgi:hypothetical protein